MIQIYYEESLTPIKRANGSSFTTTIHTSAWYDSELRVLFIEQSAGWDFPQRETHARLERDETKGHDRPSVAIRRCIDAHDKYVLEAVEWLKANR